VPAQAGLVGGGVRRGGVGLIGGLKIGAIAASDKENFRYCFATIAPVDENSCVLVIAHRGASRAETENTPAAFRRADSMGADGVELDVRVGPDGTLVIAHDPLESSDLAAHVADPTVAPLLAEVLDACGARMLVNVEIRNIESEPGFDSTMAIADRTVALLRARGGRADRWLLSSFSWATVDHCRRIAPEFATAALCTTISATALDRVERGGHAAVNPVDGAVDADLVDRVHALGLSLNVWTVNEPDRIRALRGFGVDAVVTDVPNEALAALGRTAAGAVSPRWGTRA
jgi:glycerophosphoryl diester phosphodiesterase